MGSTGVQPNSPQASAQAARLAPPATLAAAPAGAVPPSTGTAARSAGTPDALALSPVAQQGLAAALRIRADATVAGIRQDLLTLQPRFAAVGGGDAAALRVAGLPESLPADPANSRQVQDLLSDPALAATLRASQAQVDAARQNYAQNLAAAGPDGDPTRIAMADLDVARARFRATFAAALEQRQVAVQGTASVPGAGALHQQTASAEVLRDLTWLRRDLLVGIITRDRLAATASDAAAHPLDPFTKQLATELDDLAARAARIAGSSPPTLPVPASPFDPAAIEATQEDLDRLQAATSPGSGTAAQAPASAPAAHPAPSAATAPPPAVAATSPTTGSTPHGGGLASLVQLGGGPAPASTTSGRSTAATRPTPNATPSAAVATGSAPAAAAGTAGGVIPRWPGFRPTAAAPAASASNGLPRWPGFVPASTRGTVTYTAEQQNLLAEVQDKISQANYQLQNPDSRWPTFSQTQATDLYTRALAGYDQLPDSPQKQALKPQLSALANQLGENGLINMSAGPNTVPDVSFSSPPDQKAAAALAAATQAMAAGDSSTALMNFIKAQTDVAAIADPAKKAQAQQQLDALTSQMQTKGVISAPSTDNGSAGAASNSTGNPGASNGTGNSGPSNSTGNSGASNSTGNPGANNSNGKSGASSSNGSPSGPSGASGKKPDPLSQPLPNGQTPEQMISNAVLGNGG